MDEAQLKNIIGSNIVKFRKQANLTQAELAEKLSYSDKAVSKWERAEALPDVYILKQLADLFKIRTDDLLTESNPKKLYIGISIEKRIIFPLMAALAIFLIATLIFGFLIMFEAPMQKIWLCFIFAIPASALSFLIFQLVWKKHMLIAIFASVFTWTFSLALFLVTNLPDKFIFFIIPIPVQALIILWYILVRISIARKTKLA